MKIINAIFFVILFVLTINSSLYSQSDKIRIVLHQPPPGKLGVTDLWSLSITNTTNENLTIHVGGTASEEKDGLIIEAKSKPFIIKPGTTKYKHTDFSNAEIKYNNGKYKEILLRTGNTPEGNYTICLTAYNESDEILGQENCITQQVQQTGIISLMSPPDGEEISSEQSINFTWTPITGNSGYTLRIVELKGDQSPDVAMRSNQPIFEKELRTTTYQGDPIHGVDVKLGMKYAWQVSSGDVQSEIYGFTVLGGNTCTIKLIRRNEPSCCYNVQVTTNLLNINTIQLGSVNPLISSASGTGTWLSGTLSNSIKWSSNIPATGIFTVGSICLDANGLPSSLLYKLSTNNGVQWLCSGELRVDSCSKPNLIENCKVNAGLDDTICIGETLQLNANTNSGGNGNTFDNFQFNFSEHRELEHSTGRTLPGVKYCIKVWGTWSLWAPAENQNPCNPEWTIDAGYIIRNGIPSQKTSDYLMGDPNHTPMNNWWAKDNPNFYYLRPNPDVYNPQNIYYYNYSGDGLPIVFKFYDSYVIGGETHYNDNCGILNFEINECGVNCECTYQWVPAVNLSNPNIQNPVFTSNTPGTYTYTVTANCNGQISYDEVKITVKDCPQGCNCERYHENGWVDFSINGIGKKDKLKCGGIYKADAGTNVLINPLYVCMPPDNCLPKYKYKVENSLTNLLPNAPYQIGPINTQTKVTIYAYCGEKLCDSCKITIDTLMNSHCNIAATLNEINCETWNGIKDEYSFKFIVNTFGKQCSFLKAISPYGTFSNLVYAPASGLTGKFKNTTNHFPTGPICVTLFFKCPATGIDTCKITTCFTLPSCTIKGEFKDTCWTENQDITTNLLSNWLIVSDPDPNTSEPRSVSQVLYPNPYWKPPVGNSIWVYGNSVTMGKFEYQYCFCLKNTEDAKIELSFRTAGSSQLLLNGSPVPGFEYSRPQNYGNNPWNIVITSGFKNGLNCLTIYNWSSNNNGAITISGIISGQLQKINCCSE